jgi:hypothetical protein
MALNTLLIRPIAPGVRNVDVAHHDAAKNVLRPRILKAVFTLYQQLE